MKDSMRKALHAKMPKTNAEKRKNVSNVLKNAMEKSSKKVKGKSKKIPVIPGRYH